MIDDINSSNQQAIARESNVICEYLRQCAESKSPLEVVQRFRNLLLLSKRIDSRISETFKRIISSAKQQQFDELLNNCCWIILECWSDSSKPISCSQLLNTFDLIAQTSTHERHRKQLIQSIADYLQSESYFQVRAAISIINSEDVERFELVTLLAERTSDSRSLSTKNIDLYLPRYTYLYHSFIPENIKIEHLKKLIEKLQNERQKQFEIQLSQHIIYRFRLKQLARMKLLSGKANKVITKVDNPSLLSDRAFTTALKQYLGKVDGFALLERVQLFVVENELRTSYQIFKQDLYHFLIADITPINKIFKFENKLKAKLDDIFAESNDRPLNKTLIVQTCRQLFSFLIIDRANPKNSLKFTELIANLGTAQTTLILTKIALIYPEAKIDLGKKICSLAAYYQQQEAKEIFWLIKALEYLLISLTLCSGNIDVSLAKSITNER